MTTIDGYIIDIKVVNKPLSKRPTITLSLESTDKDHNIITLTELTLHEEEVKYLIQAMFKQRPITLATEIRYIVIKKEVR